MSSLRTQHSSKQRQRGVVFIVMMVIMVLGTATLLVSSLNSASLQIARDQATADALAQAKEALIGYAASVDLTDPYAASPRPGNLPCPDFTNTGTAASSCSGNALGRLPWKTLGLPELRDGSGEKLWYAVSRNFKKSPATPCTAAGQPGCLNSDTAGTITIRSSNGNIINNGCSVYGLPNCPNPGASDAAFGTGAVALIIAPGSVLTRLGGAVAQDRSSAGINSPQNYLDLTSAEDNANFTDSASADGFIQGRIKDGNGNVILNDQLLAISQDNIMQAVQKRVAGEVQNCLKDFALNNNGRYPWAAPIPDLSTPYHDKHNEYFGRIPDDLHDTDHDINGPTSDQWGTCNTHISNEPAKWWLNWKEMVFYGLANTFEPDNSAAPSFPSYCVSIGHCLNVNSASTPARFVVIVAGKALTNPDQTNRNAHKNDALYYLEGGNENANPNPSINVSNTFVRSAPSATFNDTLVYQ